MPITLNQFSPGVLTAAQLNALVNAIVAKFNGQITTGDVSFPFRVGGNIDMAQFELLHLYKLWNVRNLAERATGVTLQNVLDEVDTAGGGVVLLPADNTEIIGTGGVTIGANTILAGQGESSVFSVTGALSNHMIRNGANGDAGIVFMNAKFDNDDQSGGAFDLIALQRTVGAKFIDCHFNVTQQNGVRLLTDSAGESTLGTIFSRCKFDIDGGTAGIYMEDVNGVSVDSATEFNIIGVGAVGMTFDAFAATSNARAIHIMGTAFNHSDGTAQYSLNLVGPSTNLLRDLQIINTRIEGDATAGGVVSAILVTSMADSSIDNNVARNLNLTATPIFHINSATRFSFNNNKANTLTGTPYGLIIGATARGGVANDCSDYSACDNQITTGSHSAFVFSIPGPVAANATIADNKGSAGALEAVFEMWNLGADPTTKVFNSNITGNVSAGAATVGWANYSDLGVTRGGRAGAANNSYLIFRNNSVVGVLIGNTALDDFREGTTSDARRCLTDVDDANPLQFNHN